MSQILERLYAVVWGVPALVLILGVGLYLSIRTGFVQLRLFKRACGDFFQKMRPSKKNADGVSPFQALCTALAATVGTGNLAGVAGAIAIGGPGSTSQWHFSRLVEAKTVTLQITPTVNRLSVGQTVKLTAAVTVNGVQSSGYELTWASSDSAVATVTGGTVTARGSGSVILTATLTQIAGEPLSTPVTVSIPLTVAA